MKQYSVKDLVSVTLFVNDMSQYSKLNSAYTNAIDSGNAPVRICLETTLPENTPVLIEALAHRAVNASPSNNDHRHTMHVQSISHWAPANIGPYSQAIKVCVKSCWVHVFCYVLYWSRWNTNAVLPFRNLPDSQSGIENVFRLQLDFLVNSTGWWYYICCWSNRASPGNYANGRGRYMSRVSPGVASRRPCHKRNGPEYVVAWCRAGKRIEFVFGVSLVLV